MCRAIALTLAIGGCAQQAAPAPTPVTQSADAEGDFDGDGRRDNAAFFEDENGALSVAVTFAARPQTPEHIWGGDIASAPFFTVRTAPPGTYDADCEAYGGCTTVPAHVALPS